LFVRNALTIVHFSVTNIDRHFFSDKTKSEKRRQNSIRRDLRLRSNRWNIIVVVVLLVFSESSLKNHFSQLACKKVLFVAQTELRNQQEYFVAEF
jgi:beta-lactamase regulating signal transducer with metallopeptidase domain